MQIIKVKKNQSLFDIALQEYGHKNGVFFLVEDNNALNGVTDNVHEGDELNIRDEVINEPMKQYLSTEIIATVKDVRGQGIGWWRIGSTFKVS